MLAHFALPVGERSLSHAPFLFNRPIFPKLFQVRLPSIRLVPKSKHLGIIMAELSGQMPFLLLKQRHQNTAGDRSM